MPGQLITLPLRLYVRGARLLVHTAEDVTGRAIDTTLQLAGLLSTLRPGGGGGPAAGTASTPTRREPTSQPERARERAERQEPPRAAPAPDWTPSPSPDPRIAERAQEDRLPAQQAASNGAGERLASERIEEEGTTPTVEVDLETPSPTEPAHISTDPVLVREEAEPGAEEGAGAAVHIDPPWDGYDRMNARDIIARLSGATPAELATVQLYESATRKRQTVLQAAERQLRSAGGNG